MRRTILIALTVLALSLGLCVAGNRAVNRAVSEAMTLLDSAGHKAQLGDAAAARADMSALYASWERRGRVLELITSHEALLETRRGIVDALLCLEHGEREEFFRACAAVGVALESLRVTEALRLANVY